MDIVSRKTMQEIDSFAIKNLGIPSICLVERASLAVMKNIDLAHRDSFAIIASTGNNGADGLALARNLLGLGKDVDIYLLGNPDRGSYEFQINLNICKKLTENIYPVVTIEDMEFFDQNLERVNTIIDAIFGTGLNRPVDGVFSYVIDLINRKRIYKISIDLPSGLDADTGEALGIAVESDLVVCMQVLKKGLYESTYYRKRTVVEDIGIPHQLVDRFLGN